MLGKYPALRIHAWGGLGSQLFAVAIALQIQEKFPKRDQVIVLHTGGVTKRFPEVTEMFPEFTYEEVDDFSSRFSSGAHSAPSGIAKIFKKLLRNFALFTGFLAEENGDGTKIVRRWTLSVRGHYFGRIISNSFLSTLIERLENTVEINIHDLEISTVIHYRLGDLINLVEKQPVDPIKIINSLNYLAIEEPVIVFSDSPEIAAKLLQSSTSSYRFVALSYSTPATLLAAINGRNFVGTSSKISYWIILLRNFLDDGRKNSLPLEDSRIISQLIGEKIDIIYY